jgi:TRAP-type C4-dicarboxylate transport system permease small subunit
MLIVKPASPVLSMRRLLEKLYTGAGILAGGCIVLITVMILLQIVGRWFGVIIPSTEDFSGYLLASSSFLALAYTFRQGGHIRVTLLLHHFSKQWQQKFTIVVLGLFSLMISFGAYHLSYLVYESWNFDEVSQGYIAIPLWIPQLPMALGSVLLLIAVLDDLIGILQGFTPSFINLEE